MRRDQERAASRSTIQPASWDGASPASMTAEPGSASPWTVGAAGWVRSFWSRRSRTRRTGRSSASRAILTASKIAPRSDFCRDTCGRNLGAARLLALEHLEQKDDALVKTRILCQKPLDLAITKIADIGRASRLVLSIALAMFARRTVRASVLGCTRCPVSTRRPTDDSEGRPPARPSPRLAQCHDDLLQRRLALGSFYHRGATRIQQSSIDRSALKER